MKYNFCLTRKDPISSGSKPVEANWRELRPAPAEVKTWLEAVQFGQRLRRTPYTRLAILLVPVCHLLFTLPLPLLTLDFHIPHSLGGITIYR